MVVSAKSRHCHRLIKVSGTFPVTASADICCGAHIILVQGIAERICLKLFINPIKYFRSSISLINKIQRIHRSILVQIVVHRSTIIDTIIGGKYHFCGSKYKQCSFYLYKRTISIFIKKEHPNICQQEYDRDC